MILLLGNLRLGLVSMIPNLTPIILTMGLMGWLGLPMDLFTIMIGSIAIGLAVDDTIHFMHNFRRYHRSTGDVSDAIRLTLTGAGRAMLVTTAVLSLSFFLYMFSTLSNLFNFGLLTGFTIIMALLADLFLAPALMVLLEKHGLLPSDQDY
jgi:predicted RND superfamily exporter protein